MTEKIDPREVYDNEEYYLIRAAGIECDCNADKACVYCIDGEMYGEITTTREGNLPAPPPFILIDIPLTEEEVTRKLASIDAGKV